MAQEDLSKLHIDKSRVVYNGPIKKKPLLWAGGIAGGLLLLVLLKGIFASSETVEVTSVSQMYPSQTFTLLNASGYVVAERKAAVASKVTGRLIELYVEEGSKVKQGQVIARLESKDVLAAREQAEANLNVAKFNLDQAKAELQDATLTADRNKDLLSKGFISQSDYDASEARYRKAVAAVAGAEASIKAQTAAVQAAKVNLDYTSIRAPFDAVVLTKNADIGDIVTPIGAAADAKAAVVTIADMNSLHVEVDVSESNLEKVKKGQPCEIQLDALPDVRFRGAVHMIVPTADRSKATVMVKVRFLDKDIRKLPEMSAKVAFLSRAVKAEERNPRIVVNKKAVATRNGKQVLFVVKDGKAVMTPVTLGSDLGDMVEIAGGANTGDRVVLKPLDKVRNGERVTIAEK